jgi:hypothetical protein
LTATSWGRILSAAGSISIPGLNPAKVSVTFLPSDNTASLPVLVNGEPENVDEVRAKEILSLEDFGICVDLGGLGNEEATYWTCDFSYVRPVSLLLNVRSHLFRTMSKLTEITVVRCLVHSNQRTTVILSQRNVFIHGGPILSLTHELENNH